MNLPRRSVWIGLALCSAAWGGAPQAPRDIQNLKARIRQDDRAKPALSIQLEQEALAWPPEVLPAEDRLWFLGELSRDLTATRQWGKGLEAARQGQAAKPALPAEQLKFALLAGQALLAGGDPKGARQECESVAAQLQMAAADPSRETRLLAAHTYRLQGTASLQLALLPEAMEGCTRALSLYDVLGDAPGQAVVWDAMASIQLQSGHLEEAAGDERKAIEIVERAKLRRLDSSYHLALANIYSHLEDADRQQAELETARVLAVQDGDAFNMSVATLNLADVALKRKDYPAALEYAEAGMPLAEQQEDWLSLAICWVNKGIAMNRMGRREGIAFIQKGLDYFKSVGDRNYVPEITGVLAEEYAFNRDFEKAYQAELDFKSLSDQLRKDQDQKRIAEADAAYQGERKQREIEVLLKEQRNQSRFRVLWLLAGFLGFSTAAVLVLGRRKLQSANRALEDMTLRDPLTGLANRRYLSSRVEEDLAQVKRLHHGALQARGGGPGVPSNLDVVFLMLDMDHFKQVNDAYGHAAGDAVLKQCAGVLVKTLRDSDTLVRWGGEEFLVLAKQASRTDAHLLAERIRRAVSEYPFEVGGGRSLRKTCSIGFACYPFLPAEEAFASWEHVVSLADQCLYAAKHSGRDMCVGILPALEEKAGLGNCMDVAKGVAQGFFLPVCTPGREIRWPE